MEAILVTCGNGFIGQHFIKHIQMYASPTLKKIRVLDEREFEKKLDYADHVTVESFVGTVFDYDIVKEALNGVDTVVHLYEMKDTSMFPDSKRMMRVNVEGTRAIIAACEEHGSSVQRFLHLSSGHVMMENHIAVDANVSEIWPIPVNNWVYPDYCSSKYAAENIVFSCEHFRCFVVRLGPLYGELDDQEWGFSTQLKLGQRLNGAIPVLGDRQGTLMHTYVGNAAYGMAKALEKMVVDPTATREAVFIVDETPSTDFYSLLEPYAKGRNYRLVSLPIWFLVAFFLYWLLEKVARLTAFIQCFGLKSQLRKLPCSRVLVDYFYTYSTFSPFKGLTYLGYKPIYTYEEAVMRSLDYYAKL